jgi:RHS repeat-associated protein
MGTQLIAKLLTALWLIATGTHLEGFLMRNRLRWYWLQLWRSRPAAVLPPEAEQSLPEGDLAEDYFVWNGREYDVSDAIQYNRARYYDSTAGRWLSQDPLGYESGDGNLYPYASPPEAAPPAPDAAGRAEEGVRRSQESF